VVVQNYSLTDPEQIARERPLAICISSTFLYLDHIREIALALKAASPATPSLWGDSCP